MTDVTPVDASDIVRRGTLFPFAHTLTLNGDVLDLSQAGALVTATIRAELDPLTILDDSLEDFDVDIDSPASAGNVSFALTTDMSTNLKVYVGSAIKTIPHLLQYKVIETTGADPEYPTPLRFHAVDVID